MSTAHSLPTLKTNTRHLFLASYGPKCCRRTCSEVTDKHPTFIFSVIRSRMLPAFISNMATKFSGFVQLKHMIINGF